MNVNELYTEQYVGTIQAAGMRDPDDWFIHALQGGLENDTDITVNGTTVLTSGPVFQAVSIIAGDVSQLPLQLHRRVDESNVERDRRHPAHKLLNVQPHEEILPQVFRETMQGYALLWGNAVAVIERNGRGEPYRLTPLEPDRVEPGETETGEFLYVYRRRDTGQPTIFYPHEVLHIMGLGDGRWGYSVIDLMRNSVGHNLALQRHGNKIFTNGARPSGVLKLANKMGPDDRQALRKDWEDMHRGADNAGRVAILPAGIEFDALSISNDNAQFIESRRFSREDIAHWFNLPGYKLGAMENSSVRANLEEQNRDYLQRSLNTRLIRWEQECARKLLTRSQWYGETHFWRHNTNAFLRGDNKSRMESYTLALQNGIRSINEVRALEDENGIGPDGDVHYQQMQMIPVGQEPPPGDTPPDNPEPMEPEPPPTESNDTNARMAVRMVVANAAEKLCKIESERVKRATRNKDNFCDWLGEFYSSWTTTLTDGLDVANKAAALCGAGTELHAMTVEYCDGHKEQLLTIAGQVTTRDELHDEVSRYLANWRANAQTITEGILT